MSRKQAKRSPALGLSRLPDGPSYAGQQKSVLRLPAGSVLLTTTATTGVVSQPIVVEVAQIPGFSARFGSTFDEYRILGANVNIRPVSASSGITVFWFDEKSQASPTSLESTERVGLRLPNSNANPAAFKTMSWRARDLLDLEYTATSVTNVIPVTFKAYSDTATYGAPIAVTNLFYIEIDFIVEFRGIKST